jgi:hypothetical protein
MVWCLRQDPLTVKAIFPGVCRVQFPNKLAMRRAHGIMSADSIGPSTERRNRNGAAKKSQGLGYSAARELDYIKVGAVAFGRH